jgi:hypothetical protein
MIDVIYFDLRKAFDKINLPILINKLEKIGITGDFLSWLTNFVSNRTVSVKIGNSISSPSLVHSGVPQGCTLSPLLFNIFIADLASTFTDPNVTLKFFADDCKAYFIYDEKDILEKKSSLIAFINHFERWCAHNGQALSDKCFSLYLGRNNPRDVYSVGNSKISAVTTVIRDLGLLITPDLKWKTHIHSKITATLRKWYNFMRVIKSTNIHTLCHIYKSYIRPTLEFPSVVYNCYSPSISAPLEAVQRKITRHICFKSGKFKHLQIPNYNIRLKILNLDIDMLSVRRLKLDLVMYQSIRNERILVNRKPDPPTHSHNTRFRLNRTVISRARTQLRHNSFFVRVPKKFCKIPINIQQIKDPVLFRYQLDSIDIAKLLS